MNTMQNRPGGMPTLLGGGGGFFNDDDMSDWRATMDRKRRHMDVSRIEMGGGAPPQQAVLMLQVGLDRLLVLKMLVTWEYIFCEFFFIWEELGKLFPDR
jgi:hypothetical protein